MFPSTPLKSLHHLCGTDLDAVRFRFSKMIGLPDSCFDVDASIIEAASNSGEWLRTGDGMTGIDYVKADSEDTDFGTSTAFLPDPAVENQLTFDLLFVPRRLGQSETHILWSKGNGIVNNSSFSIGWNTVDKPVVIFRFDSGGPDEATGSITGANVLIQDQLTHLRFIYDGTYSGGVLAALYIDNMDSTAPVGVYAGPGGPNNGIENTTSYNMRFGSDGSTYGEGTVFAGLIRKDIRTEQAL